MGIVTEILDPLGLANPFIVQAKILTQDLWEMGDGMILLLKRSLCKPNDGFQSWRS